MLTLTSTVGYMTTFLPELFFTVQLALTTRRDKFCTIMTTSSTTKVMEKVVRFAIEMLLNRHLNVRVVVKVYLWSNLGELVLQILLIKYSWALPLYILWECVVCSSIVLILWFSLVWSPFPTRRAEWVAKGWTRRQIIYCVWIEISQSKFGFCISQCDKLCPFHLTLNALDISLVYFIYINFPFNKFLHACLKGCPQKVSVYFQQV